MNLDKSDLKTRIFKHYLLPTGVLIYFLIGAFFHAVPMFSVGGTIELADNEALFLSIGSALWLVSDLIMYEPILKLTKNQRLFWGTVVFLPAVYVFYNVIFA